MNNVIGYTNSKFNLLQKVYNTFYSISHYIFLNLLGLDPQLKYKNNRVKPQEGILIKFELF